VALIRLLNTKPALLVGRAPECEVCLPHPSVSRHHALLSQTIEGVRLEDLASLNGVMLNGHRLAEPAIVRQGERIGIGPFLCHLAGDELLILDNSRSLRLEAHGLEKIVPAPGGQGRKLLDGISLVVEPGEFVSLLGPSGSGKSTLMDCLNGRRPATGGRVLANGEDFYVHFDSLRQSLGYVPQRDIVHTQLPVRRALYYTARLRLPTDTGPAELDARINEVIKQMELGPHQSTLVGSLSGGQIKRVSLGAELLARPCLLYIDEATSGLDAGTEARMMRLFRQLADEGKSVLCITHNVDNVDLCDLITILARGKLVYYGPPAEARPYFGVSRISEVYDQLSARDPADWEKQFAASSLCKCFVQDRLTATASGPPAPPAAEPLPGGADQSSQVSLMVPPPPARTRAPAWHQFRVLTLRYLELIVRDRNSLRLLALQAPVIALVILCGFLNRPYQEKVLIPRRLSDDERQALTKVAALLGDFTEAHRDRLDEVDRRIVRALRVPVKVAETEGPVLPEYVIVNPRYTYMLLFLVVIIVLWLACSNASKEIVKEEAIYGRERAVNLAIAPYLASKVLVLGAITALQVALLMTCIYGPMELMHAFAGTDLPYEGYRLNYLHEYGLLVMLSLTGIAMGLFLSAVVSSPEQANALLPYVLIPQIILGGGVLQFREGPLYYLAVVTSPAYWAYRGIHRGSTHLPPDLPITMNYNDNPWLATAALGLQAVILLLLAAWFLKRKDVHKA
jgi:ABC-type multidrug transport system ATPase subunit